VIAYTISYAVGATLSWRLLHRILGATPGGELLGFLRRLVVAGLVTTAVTAALWWGLGRLGPDPAYVVALGRAAALTLVAVLTFVLMARTLRLREVTDVLELITRRLPSRDRA
jgi:putative peptidoglycan lipid II flippase